MVLKWELMKNFAMGGAVISSVSYLATFVSPLFAAILWSYPFSILPTVYFMKRQGKSNVQISKFLFSTSYALILLLLATLVMGLLIKNDTGDTGFASIAKATVIWFVGSICMYLGVHITGTAHLFM